MKVAIAAVALTNFYLLGVMLMFQRIDYPLFVHVPRAEFPSYYAVFTRSIALPVVIPEFLALLSVIPLFFFRPASVPAWSVAAVLGAGVLYMVITFGWHLPVHRMLANGDNSQSVVDALVRTNGMRTLVQAAKCGLVFWMITR